MFRFDDMVARCYHIFGCRVVARGTVSKPSYSLGLIKGLMKEGDWILTLTAEDTAVELGFDDEDVYDCIVNFLAETHFYKTMESEKKPGLMQDVYHITYGGYRLYVKLQVSIKAVVVSFKEQ